MENFTGYWALESQGESRSKKKEKKCCCLREQLKSPSRINLLASVILHHTLINKRGGAIKVFGLTASTIVATSLTSKKASFFLSVKWKLYKCHFYL